MWQWGSRSPDGATPRWTGWWVFSSIPWCCGSIWPVIPTVAELLAQVRQRSLAAYEHQDVPFEVLVERLNPTRSLTHHPLVQVMLAWQNLPGDTGDPAAGLTLGELQVTPMPVDTRAARVDLSFSLAERWNKAGEPAGIGGAVEFRTDVFDTASIQAIDRAVAAGAGGDDRRSGAALVVGGCAG